MRWQLMCVLGLIACGEPKAQPEQPAPSASATASSEATAAPGPATPVGCLRKFDGIDEAAIRALPLTSLAALLADKPREGVFRTRGRPVAWHPCPACPPGAMCKPCETTIVLSDAGEGETGPELRMVVPKPSAFHRGKTYEVGLEVCPTPSTERAPLHVELRGAWPLGPD